jgi:hypothetical protein
MEEQSQETSQGDATGMAAEVGQTKCKTASECDCSARKRKAPQQLVSGVACSLHESKRRAIMAATEFLACGKGREGLGITDLCRKHCCANSKATGY